MFLTFLLTFLAAGHAVFSLPVRRQDANATSGTPKYVVAHHIVGNTFPYTVDDWANDIALASASGIDAFALNVGSDSWQPAHVADAFTAASRTNTSAPFKLFLSFDMSAMPCSSADDAQALRNYITTYAAHPNQLTYGSPPRAFASTFAGESCTFGQGSVADGWKTQFSRHPDLTGQNAVYFVPSFFVDPATFSTYADVMDGVFNFNSGWPITLTTDKANSILSAVGTSLSALVGNGVASVVQNTLAKFVGATDTDDQYRQGLGSMSAPVDTSGQRAYMAAVSPWFFTHYSPQTFNKNFIYLADSHLYPTRWENLVATRDAVQLAQIVTWNDYGESHYIGPIEGAQPNSQAWVDGLNHTGWLDMTAYYAAAFKTGQYPPITQDRLYLWARPHAAGASAPDPVGRPANAALTEDALWAVVFARAPANVTLNGAVFQVGAGVSKLSVPLAAGAGMRGTVEREGATVVEVSPAGYTFQGSPQSYNYNAFVAYGVGQS